MSDEKCELVGCDRQPLANEMINEMDCLVERLSRLVERTDTKLASVYLAEPEPPSDVVKEATAYPQLFNTMRDLLGRGNYLISKVEVILDKVEL